MSARDEILAGIRDAARRTPTGRDRGEGEEEAPGPGARVERPIPGRARASGEARVDLFIEKAKGVDATVVRIDRPSGVPEGVAAYLEDAGLAPAVAVHGGLGSLDWYAAGIDPEDAAADDEGPVLLPAYAGVAEIGSICLTSVEAPLRAAFLPETLLVVLMEDDVVSSYEDLWRRGREDWARSPPASLVLVGGPSRTADIEQSLVLGAHGPRRLHVLLVRGRDR